MDVVTVSPKFQVVVPKRVRSAIGLKPGQKLMMLVVNGQVRLVPMRAAKAMRGLLKGTDASFERESDRDL